MAISANSGSEVVERLQKLLPDDPAPYTTVNTTTDRDLDGSTLTVDGVADVLGTLIDDLRDRGIIG